MNISKYLPIIYFILGLAFSVLAYSSSFEVVLQRGREVTAAGGTLAFALLSGICFACCAYLAKKN
jgi:hypothetical protein